MQKFADNGKGYGPTEPLHTVMAGAPRHAVITAHLEQANGSPEARSRWPGRSAEDPLSTIVAKGCTSASSPRTWSSCAGRARTARASTSRWRRSARRARTSPRSAPSCSNITATRARGTIRERPLGTVTTKDRFGLVTVTIGGEEYVIVDIGMRMLTPRELFNAQGFPPDYIIDHDAAGQSDDQDVAGRALRQQRLPAAGARDHRRQRAEPECLSRCARLRRMQ
jgi:DNA (cytosine-5)-methyltransferase 1